MSGVLRHGVTASSLAEAVSCRDRELAKRALDQLARTTRPPELSWRSARGPLTGTASDGDAADKLYRHAIERLKRTRLAGSRPCPPDLREWLRRSAAGSTPRDQLRTALELFTRMGGRGVRRGQSASCWRPASASSRGVETWDELTAQEAQVARSPATSRTPRSARGCSSARTPSPTTSARCSPSSNHLAQPARPSASHWQPPSGRAVRER